MDNLNNRKGFTIIELILVIAVLAILVSIAVPRFIAFTENARLASDKHTVRNLNTLTTIYALELNKYDDIFENYGTDLERLEELVDKKYMNDIPKAQGENNKFNWIVENQVWIILNGDSIIPLSPFGNTFEEVSKGIITRINENYINKGNYGRTWGEYQYTDIDLDPEDWKVPVSHIYYKPQGSQLRISPEEGYNFKVKDVEGNTKVLTYSLNWDLLYDSKDKNWYYHSISDKNKINIETLEVERRN